MIDFRIDKARVPIPDELVSVAWEVDPEYGIVRFVADQADPIFQAPNDRVLHLIELMEKHGVDLSWGRPRVRAHLIGEVKGFMARNSELGEAIDRRRKAVPKPVPTPISQTPQKAVPKPVPDENAEEAKSPTTNKENTCPQDIGDSRGQVATGACPRPPPSKEGDRGTPGPETAPKPPPPKRSATRVAKIVEPELLLCPSCGEVSMAPHPVEPEMLWCGRCLHTVTANAYPYRQEK